MAGLEFVEWSDLTWSLTPQTFVPRPSSLAFVRFVREEAPAGIPLLIDLCCGSGALGIALFRSMPDRFERLLLLDCADDALFSADVNRIRHEVPGETRRWFAGEPLPAEGPAVVVCNPPFLPDDVSEGLPDWERQCVAGGEDGLDVVRKCFASVAGSGRHLMLKCLAAQVESLRSPGRTLRTVRREGDAAFSHWMCV